LDESESRTIGNKPTEAAPVKNDPRTIFGWAMYDWANSAYATTTMAAVFPIYFAATIVPEDGVQLFGRTFTASALWGYGVGISTFLIFLLTPILGAVADFSATKKRFLRAFAYGGALFATGDVMLAMGLFLVTQVGFVGANVFYDGFLPDITTPDTIDRVSAKGYGLGYIGGGLQFSLALLLITFHESLGLSVAAAARISLAMVGVWWLAFSTFAFTRLRETGQAQLLPERYAGTWTPVAYWRVGFGRVWETAKKLIGFKQLLLFLIAYMIYVDGIQTVILTASIYAKETLQLPDSAIMVALLIVQIVAFMGAFFFGRLAGRIGTRAPIMACLTVYALVTIVAYFLPAGEVLPFIGMAAAIGFVQGGAQSLSRSLFGSMIPEEASAEFYGFYSVLSKFAAIWGPIIFGAVALRTGSARPAIVSLIAFFIVGGTLLALVNVEEARASRMRWSFESKEN
jgi:UMF1 family MFS transporter